ncbi:hypothetical protein [Stappia sp. ES.058]|uniref:hypothetical protein n=1 Tax=Stappia sp. ES.058 TaxID=1881061 RepID=UPI00087D5B1B|nr:hypothetical protein [Stappia sp. ES.058]SDT91617.1 hypothetical protein SAMN05428979_0368 [Stappia sp. ES.058]
MPFKRGRLPEAEEARLPFNVEVLNESAADQTFVMLADPGTATVAPNAPAPLPLAWLVGVIPGKVDGIVSAGYFFWSQDFAYALGEITSKGAGTFMETLAAPMAVGGNNTVETGFTGSAGQGAPKLISVGASSNPDLTMSSNGDVPNATLQAAALVYYAGSWAIGEADTAGRYAATRAIQYLPNLTETLVPAASYAILAASSRTTPGDVLSATVVSKAYAIDFAGAPIVRLTYTASNTFQPS